MCGIVGLYAYNSRDISVHEFDNFVDSLAHRGPDGRGVYHDFSSRLHLGHRRLKILDLSESGSQPMSYAKGRYWLTYNGEIYNFIEVKEELKSKGYQFNSESDAEVILASYIEWKEKCLDKFNGMWAFAVWDTLEKKLFFSRDRFGVKPFYYFFNNEFFAFASEMKAFSFLSFDLSFNSQEVSNAIYNPSIVESSERTLFKNVHRLLPGHYGTFSLRKGFQLAKWWDTKNHLININETFDEQTAYFRHLFKDACKIRMRSDVAFGTSLSGGLDSSSVLSMISHIKNSKNINKNRHPSNESSAFVISYPNSSQDELEFAKEMIANTKSISHIYEVAPSDLITHFDNVLFSIEGIFDLPIGPWLVYRNFRENGFQVSIDGHGADEILGGYHHHVETMLLNSIFPIPRIKEFITVKKQISEILPKDSPFTYSIGSCLSQAMKLRIKNNPFLYRVLNFFFSKLKHQGFLDWFLTKPKGCSALSASSIKEVLYRDFHQTTLPVILKNFDCVSMAHGVEVRSPFLDWRLVTYALSLPKSSLIGSGFTKRILREAMCGFLPEDIRLRKSKVGFASPIIEWYKSDLKTFILDILNSQSFLQSNIWDGRVIRDFVLKCYANNDPINARKSWEFIQAHRLIELFTKRPSNVS